MARVTVEDCIDKVPNRFELVLLRRHRARTISQGRADRRRARQRQEPGGGAARDCRGRRSPDDLREDFIHSMQKHVEVDEPEASECR